MPPLLNERGMSRTAQRSRLGFPYLLDAPGVVFLANCLTLAVGARNVGLGDFGSLASVVAMLVLLSLPGAAVASLLAREDGAEGDDRPVGASAGDPGLRLLLAGSVAAAMLSTAVALLLAAAAHVRMVGPLLLGPYTSVTMLAAVPIAFLSRGGRVGAVRTVTLGSLIALAATGIPLLRSDPSITMLLLANLLGAFVALGLGIAFTGSRSFVGWLNRPQPDLGSSLRLYSQTLVAPGAFWLLALIDVILAKHYLPASLAGAYAAAALTGRLVLSVPLAIGYLKRTRPELPGMTPDIAGSTIRWVGIAGAVLTVAALLMALFWEQTVSLVFGGTSGSAILALPPLGVSGVFVAASLVPARFHLSVDSRAHYMTLFLVGLEVLLVVLWHGSSQMAMIVVAVTALSLFLQLEAAYAILRWEPMLARLTEPQEIQRLEKGSEGSIELSLILPCYNAGAALSDFIEHLDRELAGGGPYELIVVSDGSTDETVAVATASTSRAVRVLHYQVRSGKGHALRVGLARARGTFVAFIDADGDIDPTAIGPFLSLMKMYTPDIILGSKRHPLSSVAYPASRRVMSWIYHRLTRLLFRINVHDTQTGLKLIRRDVLASVLPLMLEKRYAFDLEFLVVARSLGFFRVFEAPVRINYRFKSQVNPQAVLRILLDTLAIFYRCYILNTYRRLEAGRPLFVAAASGAKIEGKPHSGLTDPHSHSLFSAGGDHPPSPPSL
jgi:glycosyltransferase involved in cell wall biosynthesis